MATIADLTEDILTHTGSSRLVFKQVVLEFFVNDAIRRMERKHHFRGQEVTLDPFPYPANADFVPVPVDFVTERAVWQKNTAVTNPSSSLAPIQGKTLRRFWIEGQNPALLKDSVFPAVAAPTPPSGFPTANESFYYIWNRGLYIVPTPSVATGITLVLDYVRILPDLTGPQGNWFTETYADVVRAGAVAEAWRFLQVADAAQLWEAAFQDRLLEAVRHDSTLALSGPPSSRGRGDN